jgi:energy-coupling factor transporter ATP-binding protein EcfA2
MRTYPRQSWDDHLNKLKWKQGEHVLIAAPTGSGKTVLAQQLAQRRGHVVIFATKPKDPTLTKDFKDWDRIPDWNGLRAYMTRVIVWPKYNAPPAEMVVKHKAIFSHALNKIIKAQNWAVLFDEMHYMTDREFLNLHKEVAYIHHMGRSSGISAIDCMQRPAWVPKIVYSSVSHAYIARTKDAADLKRLSDLGNVDPKELAYNVANLPSRFDFVYVNPQGDSPPVIVNTRK